MQRFAVIGLGRFGSRLASSLAIAGQEVLAFDRDVRIIDEIKDRVTLAVALDATDPEALRAHGVDRVDCAIVGIGNDLENAALITAVLKELGIPRVVSRAMTHTAGRILSRIGADDVAYPENESADRWASQISNPNYMRQLDLDATHSLIEVMIPAPWVGSTVADLGLSSMGMSLVAVKRIEPTSADDKNRIVFIPKPDDELQQEDILLLIGKDVDLARLPRAVR